MVRVGVGLLIILAGCGKRERGKEAAPAAEPPVAAPRPPRPSAPSPPPPSAVDAPPTGCAQGGRTTCAGDQIVECLADGSPGEVVRTCDTGCSAGACVDTCAVQDVELVYVVDTARDLSSFDPRKLPGNPFHRVGPLGCDASSGPFSMAVDRKGIAWILYASGTVHRASIADATCWRSDKAPSGDAPRTFGMGFATDGPNTGAETLYGAAADSSKVLGRLDVTQRPPRWTPIAPVAANVGHNPELTGTADGKLFGYFPDTTGGYVQEIDRATGQAAGQRLEVTGARGRVGAYAFAHWGGVFYVFATIDGNSAVHAVNRKTGAYQLVMDHLPHPIVGAGVSTCAPLLERVP